jgi:site-specific DNA-methyltransferase (adenine-specific)
MSRLIESCSFTGDCVLDVYAGSGTTAAAARKLGRAVVSIDESPEALEVARNRLKKAGFPPLELKIANQPPKPLDAGEARGVA